MVKLSDIAISVDLDEKFKRKLRAIAKHTAALADELDAIDKDDEEDPYSSKVERTNFSQNAFNHDGKYYPYERLKEDMDK